MEVEMKSYAYDVNCPEELHKLLFRKYLKDLWIERYENRIRCGQDLERGTTDTLDFHHAERYEIVAELDLKYPHWDDEEQARKLYCRAEQEAE